MHPGPYRMFLNLFEFCCLLKNVPVEWFLWEIKKILVVVEWTVAGIYCSN